MEKRGVLVIGLALAVAFAILAVQIVSSSGSTPALIIFWNGTEETIPAGWSCISCNESDDFYERYPVTHQIYIGMGGSTTHIHNLTASSTGPSSAVEATPGLINSFNVAGTTHTHNSVNPSNTTSATSLPLTKALLVIVYDAGIPETIPAGAIGFFNGTSAPENFSMYTEQDGYFVMGSNETKTIGQATHNHTGQNYSTGGPSGFGVGDTGLKAPIATTTHTHPLGEIAWEDDGNHAPLFLEMPLIYATTDAPIPPGFIAFFNSTVSEDWQGMYDEIDDPNYYIKGNSSSFNTTGGSETHNHTGVTVISGISSGSLNIEFCDFFCGDFAEKASTHNVTIVVQNVNNQPPYKRAVLAMYSPTNYANETEGREAIEDGILNATPSATIYTDLEVDIRYFNGTQDKGVFDKVSFNGTQRWGFNYVTSGESFTNMQNSSYNVFNVWEDEDLTFSQIFDAVRNFIINSLN